MSRPFWWPITITEVPPSRAQPPTIDGIVAVEPVAVELDEVGEDGAEVVERVRATRVPGHHAPAGSASGAVDLLAHGVELVLQQLDLAADVDLAVARRDA